MTIPGTERGEAPPLGPPNEVEFPVWGHGHEIGRLVLVLPDNSIAMAIPADDRAIAVALVDQLGAVLATATNS